MRSALSVTVLWLATACSAVLGIDGDYELAVERSSGGSGNSGETDADVPVHTGGRTGTGGSGGVGGTGGVGSGGTPEGGSCGAGEKLCLSDMGDEVCVAPNPAVGCGLTGCDPCAAMAPPNEVASACENGECKFECRLNFERVGTTCEPVGGGGGSPGTGGSGPTTCRVGMDGDCPRCSQTVAGCCAIAPNPGTCGCWAVWCVAL